MGNKRQRLAKQRLIADGTVKVEKPATDGNGTSNGGEKKVKSKKRANESGDANGSAKKKKVASTSKHPLRQAGMKPGEGCFLCKAKDHIAKNCPTKSAADRHKMCLGCRTWGHTLKNCPSEFKSTDSKKCYNCGETGHSLDKCPQPLKDGGSAFAECFLCKQRGHLSKNCPDNKNGIYPKGGCCKICEAVTHLAKDCPQKNAGKFAGNPRVKLKISTDSTQISTGVAGKRTVFKSGDDLEDDFQEEDGKVSDEEVEEVVNEEPGNAPKTQKSDMRKTLPRGKQNVKKQNPKVVKF